MTKSIASIGFRTKTAKAIAVALTYRSSPEFVQRWNLELYDRDVPETSRPHHEVMELPWPEAELAVRRYEKLIPNVTTERLRTLLEELRSRAVQVCSVGVVGSPDRSLEKIGNHHIRAHAAEGILFRRPVEIAATRCSNGSVDSHGPGNGGLRSTLRSKLIVQSPSPLPSEGESVPSM